MSGACFGAVATVQFGRTEPGLVRDNSNRMRTPVVVAAGVVLLAAGALLGWHYFGTRPLGLTASSRASRDEPTATYVGAQACARCHAKEHAAWTGSDHARAMQVASEATVLGDFVDRRFAYGAVTSMFSRRDGRYMVRTDGPDGKPADFEIKYTFGVRPLQQYLIELPGGRLQALSIAWDARPRESGGQRWFHLYPDQKIDYRDELHWTRRQQNWNYMCADCHSTNVRKNYDAAADRYATTWSEINVACEACHGPGSRHVAWADAARPGQTYDATDRKGLTAVLRERRGVQWAIDPSSGNAKRSTPRATAVELGVCAQCHARRSQISSDYVAGRPFLDHYLPALLTPPLYWSDGQQRDEVYTWGSFLESRMHAAGVTCSDCHEPHSQKLRAPGNQVCAQCHAPAKYDAATHHFHRAGGPGAECAGCHMSVTRYMVIDPRHDHSLRVPRPDQSAALGVPNACTRCHAERKPDWAVARMQAWYGHNAVGYQRFAEAFRAAETGADAAARQLAVISRDPLEPAIVRASALVQMSRDLGRSPSGVDAVKQALGDADPLVRRAAVTAVESLPPDQRSTLATPLLSDPARLVRIEAARVLAPVRPETLDQASRPAYERAAAEFVAAQRTNDDRPESRTNLGTYFAARGRVAAAETEMRAALALDPTFVPAYVNLADIYRAEQREPDVRRVLAEGLTAVPDDASLHYALGLALVRAQRTAEALTHIERAAARAPDNVRFVYTYAVSLYSTGKAREAIAVLEKALQRRPNDRDVLVALVTFNRDQGASEQALRYAERMAAQYPDDPEAQRLVAQLRARSPR
jgi:tetratricopeptide (TPR) repeat protein